MPPNDKGDGPVGVGGRGHHLEADAADGEGVIVQQEAIHRHGFTGCHAIPPVVIGIPDLALDPMLFGVEKILLVPIGRPHLGPGFAPSGRSGGVITEMVGKEEGVNREGFHRRQRRYSLARARVDDHPALARFDGIDGATVLVTPDAPADCFPRCFRFHGATTSLADRIHQDPGRITLLV